LKLDEISEELTKLMKTNKNECDDKYKETIKYWCKQIPIKNTVKAVWVFLESIKDMVSDNVPNY